MTDNFVKVNVGENVGDKKRKWTKDKRQEDAYDLRQRLQND